LNTISWCFGSLSKCIKQLLCQIDVIAHHVAAVGIASQHETAVIGDRTSSAPSTMPSFDNVAVAHTVVLRNVAAGGPDIRGFALVQNAYRCLFFSHQAALLVQASALVLQRVDNGEFHFRTMDSWLVYQMTG
jgi:glycerol kinase